MCMCVGMYTLCAEIDGLPSANATEHCVHSCNSPQQSNKLFIPWLPQIAQTLGLIIGDCRVQPRHSKSRLAAEAQLEYNSWGSLPLSLTKHHHVLNNYAGQCGQAPTHLARITAH